MNNANDYQIEKIKYLAQSVIERKGDINNMGTKDPEYNQIKDLKIFDDSGRQLKISEKLGLIGLSYTPKRFSQDENISNLKQWLDDFVASGGNVNNLGTKDKLYHKIKDLSIVKNGKLLSVEEKFTFAGHPRSPKKNNYENISNVLDGLSYFEDKNGFVDSYRKDKEAEYRVKLCASVYKLPEAIIIELLANKRLKKYYLNINREDYLKVKLEEYLQIHPNFIGIKRLDPALYEKLKGFARSFPSKTGQRITTSELINYLGFGDIENSFLTESKATPYDVNEFFEKYKDVILANNNTISIADIELGDYFKLTFYLRRKDILLPDFFAQYGITYLYPKIYQRNSLVTTTDYPFLNEMKQERDEMLKNYFEEYPQMKHTGTATLFTIKLKICQEVYKKYYAKILEKFCGEQSQSINGDNIYG